MNRFPWIREELAEVLELFALYGAWTQDANDVFVNPALEDSESDSYYDNGEFV